MIVPHLVGLALLGSGYRDRYPLPTGVVPDGWGVNIHFTEPKAGEMEAIRAAGFRWVRMDLLWNAVERRKGVYDFREYDALMGHLDRVGIRPMFILCYGNALYQAGPPTSREARAAFARFAAAAVERYQGRGVVWEMWNEPNQDRFWAPQADPKQYVELALAVGSAIRDSAPDEWFVGPATSGFDWPFLTACFEAGLLGVWDAVTVHPYRQTPPETVGGDWARLRALMQSHGGQKPLLSGEWGYSDRAPGLDRDTQAQYAVRQYVANLASGVNMSIWYDWRDDGQSPSELEHHFGVVGFDRAPKPAYEAVRTFARWYEGKRVLRVLPGNRVLFSGSPTVTWRPSTSLRFPMPSLPEESMAVRTPWPESPWVVQDTAGLRETFRTALGSLPSDEALHVTILDREVPVNRAHLDSAAEAVWSALVIHGLQQMSVSTLHGPVWAGWAMPANRGEFRIERSAARQEIRVVLKPPMGSREGRVEVELTIGLRVLRQRVDLRDGRGEATFPWYRWEHRAEVQASVVGADSTYGPAAAAPISESIDLFEQGRWTARAQGDLKVATESTLKRSPSLPGGPAPEALQFDYRTEKGWTFFELHSRSLEPIQGIPEWMEVWVHGDGSGDMLRMRFTDAVFQTFQPHYGPIDWIGWRKVRFPLRGVSIPSWGGPDGVIHYPIVITVPVLVDPSGRVGSGSIQIAGLVVKSGR